MDAGNFNLLLNRESTAEIAVCDDSALLPADSLSRETLLGHALAHREELQQAGDAIRIAGAQRRVATASFKPSVAVAASYGVQGDRYRFDSKSDVAIASLVLSWNVFNGGQDRARVAESALAQDEATYRRRELVRVVEMQVNGRV